jgi:hypothetical protein
MSTMGFKSYLPTLPERLVRSALGLGAGVVREVGELALPKEIRQGRLYQNLVDTTLRYLIEQVGGVEGVYRAEDEVAENFLVRRTAGNALEVLGVVAFRASPVWVLAAVADLCGAGRHLIPEIADALKAEGLLDKDTQFTSVDQILDGLERSSSRLASTINTPPLDVPSLRKEWQALRDDIGSIPPDNLPSRETIREVWGQLRDESVRQQRSVFELSTMMSMSAVAKLPDNIRWLSSSAKRAATRTGEVFASTLLDHYRQTLSDIREVGYVTYGIRQFRPYVRGAVNQFSPKRRTLTERVLERFYQRSGSGKNSSTSSS